MVIRTLLLFHIIGRWIISPFMKNSSNILAYHRVMKEEYGKEYTGRLGKFIFTFALLTLIITLCALYL